MLQKIRLVVYEQILKLVFKLVSKKIFRHLFKKSIWQPTTFILETKQCLEIRVSSGYHGVPFFCSSGQAASVCIPAKESRQGRRGRHGQRPARASASRVSARPLPACLRPVPSPITSADAAASVNPSVSVSHRSGTIWKFIHGWDEAMATGQVTVERVRRNSKPTKSLVSVVHGRKPRWIGLWWCLAHCHVGRRKIKKNAWR